MESIPFWFSSEEESKEEKEYSAVERTILRSQANVLNFSEKMEIK